MSARILCFSLNELALDPEGVAAAVTKACSRDEGRRVATGLCQASDSVLIPLEEAHDGARREYVIAAFDGFAGGSIAGDLQSRWQGGFITRGLIRFPGVFLGLFERAES